MDGFLVEKPLYQPKKKGEAWKNMKQICWEENETENILQIFFFSQSKKKFISWKI